MGGLRPHQDSDLVQLLPLAVEGEQGADLEVSGRDVERLRDAGPLLQVPEPGPAGDTVVDDEELAALGVSGHDTPVHTSSRGAGGSSSWLTVAIASRVGDSSSGQPTIRPRCPRPPVVQIARNDDEVDVLLSGLPDQSVEHLSRRSPDSRGEAAFLSREAEERTLQMNVRRVEKAK